MAAKGKKKQPTGRRGGTVRLILVGVAGVAIAAGAALMIRMPGKHQPAKLAAERPAARIALPLPPPPAPPMAEPAAPPPAHASPPPASLAAVTPPRAVEVPPWRKFAVAVAPAAGDARPQIAIVIDDMGVDRKRSARAAALPGPLTLSWLPYSQDVGRQAAAARAAGHEILLHMPMQPLGHENPGPNALTVDLPPDEVRRRLGADLALLPEAVGLNNHMGSRFTRDPQAMAPVIDEVKRRGLLFLDSRTSAASIGADVAREAGVPYTERDVFLDNEMTVEAVRARLAETELIARRRGIAIAIGHPHEATLEALDPWLRTLAERGFRLIPISAAVQYRLEHPPQPAARG
jgi:polysaccharide deacetylase 2 family uncharacterized protein YibQ